MLNGVRYEAADWVLIPKDAESNLKQKRATQR